MNHIIISGFVSSEPISRYTSNGNHVIHFSISVRKGTKRNDGGTGYAVNFFDVDAWGKTAAIANDRLVKGEKVYIEGRLDNDIYEQSGQKRSRTKIIAEYIEYSSTAYDDDEQEAAKP
jgi:single stranded DNA-binding protein (ssb)